MSKIFNAWPKDWPKELNYPQLPVFSILDLTAERVPDRRAIVFGGLELTYGQLQDLINRFAHALHALGIQKGDRVAVHLPNCPQFAVAYYGALKTGAIFTPLSPLFSPREALHQLNDAGAKVLVSLDLIYPGIAEIIPDTGVAHIITTSIADCYAPVIAPLKPLGKIPVPDTLDMVDLLRDHPPEPPAVSIDPENDLAHLAYTGGTTGVSKGVMMTHANIVTNVIQVSNWFSGAQVEFTDGKIELVYPPGVDPVKDRPIVQDRETALVVVPWFHAMGTVGYLNNQVYGGNTMIVFPRFEPAEYLGAIGKYGATMLGGAPQLYIPMVNEPDFDDHDLSSIKLAASGAAPLAGSVLDQMLDAFSGVVCEAYGLTECTMCATANPPDRDLLRVGSVGVPIFDTEVKVVDVASGEEKPFGEEGEVCIRGPQVMIGYWNRPEATAEVLKDGWLHTGDVGRMDEDGFLFITDRIKDLIIYKGYNVYPREIEEVLFQHPAVMQCAVVGKPDEAGELPVAFVQLQPDMEASDAELMEFANKQLAPYKKIREVVFVDAIPVSAAGKVLKRELREQLT